MADEFLKRDFTEEELVELAKKRLKVKRDLYSHIASYVFVNAFLLFVTFFSNDFTFSVSGISWNFWVLAGWGLGLLFHMFGAFYDLTYKYSTNTLNKEIAKITRPKE